jgi:hypothetical protein
MFVTIKTTRQISPTSVLLCLQVVFRCWCANGLKYVTAQHLPVQLCIKYDVKNRVLKHGGEWSVLVVEKRVSAGRNDLQGLQNALALVNISEKFNFDTKLYSFDIRVDPTQIKFSD